MFDLVNISTNIKIQGLGVEEQSKFTPWLEARTEKDWLESISDGRLKVKSKEMFESVSSNRQHKYELGTDEGCKVGVTRGPGG